MLLLLLLLLLLLKVLFVLTPSLQAPLLLLPFLLLLPLPLSLLLLAALLAKLFHLPCHDALHDRAAQVTARKLDEIATNNVPGL